MALEVYRKKRRFGVTPEPRGQKAVGGGFRYVIQKHAARRLHYDLRLELDGVMKSWAVTRGPSLDPNEKRLAVQVEDHPVDYNKFEGTIPQGEYGGGTVMIWDRGRWIPQGDPHKGLAKGHLEFELEGQKLHGRWHLVRLRSRPNDRHANWLLIKGKDEHARGPRDKDILEEMPLSAATGRSMEEIAAGTGGKRVWHSNRKAEDAQASRARMVKPLPKPRVPAPVPAKRRAKSAAKKPASTARRSAAKPRARTKAATTAIARKSAEPRSRAAKLGRPAPLPEFVPPSLATLREQAPSGPDWLHEIKFDGYRIEARLDHGEVRLLTRHQQDWTHRFGPVAAAVKKLAAETALLDGELVVEDERGISSFSLLQIDLKEDGTDRFRYYVFDLLYLDGRDVTGEPLVARKAALERLIADSGNADPIHYAGHFEEDGPVIHRHACEMKLEGIVSKRKTAPYRSGRSENFIKTKCHDRQEFVVVGFTPSTALAKAIGALTVAYYDNGELRYAGRIGTGYTQKTARDLWKRLEALRTDRPPLAVPKDERRKNVIWVKPQMVIEAEFRGWTHDARLRQAAFKGLREDKPAREVVREIPAAAAPAGARDLKGRKSSPLATVAATLTTAASKQRARPARAGSSAAAGTVHLTHPDRVYWVDVGVTKEDLAEYYLSVWDFMAPHVAGRPLALVRCPDGTKGECFFQKHIPSNVKNSPLRHIVDAKEQDVIVIETVDDLIAVVQSGGLEIHVRGSRLDALEVCDRVVFDLDPGEGVTWKEIVAAARETRERLKAEKLESFAKLSGGKGIHVVVPIADADWETVKNFTQRIATAMTADDPQRYVAKMTKSLRPGKIFIDYFRNSREATSVCAYSTRARPGAPISAPVSWERLARTTGGNQFTVLNATKLIKSDPWAGMAKVRQKLPKG